MVILITGATGNVGSSVLTYLQHQNLPIRAAIPNYSGEREKLPQETEYTYLEFGKPDTYSQALVNVDKLFLMRPPPIEDVKRMMFPFLDCAKESGVKFIILLSLMGVNPLTPHYKLEKYIQKLGFSYIFVRPSFYMQNLSTTHAAIIRDMADLLIPAGNSRTSFIDTRDLGEAIGRLLENPPTQYFNSFVTLTGPEALDYYDVSRIMTQILGRPISYSSPKMSTFKTVMLQYGFTKDHIKIMGILYQLTKLGNANKVTHDLGQILQRSPRTLRVFIQDFHQIWMKPSSS